ncbi:hypothetical protein HCG51_08905 [Tolypothrix sp. PCC 7910]|uniref:hypothetical protein n=1 Tax=Tolypothrix sp. PCC 7910 TaxID=2099387 RepID=UPI00142785F0|nr:hypothetical protein [Tolypothrix sp. PCC 7910]QIR36849.1 hypothetical protein HCG51_08905 [Tolypothrix sp. PCC 7910]
MGTKPLGYWSCDYTITLITDIAETWGDNLERLTEPDALWLISRIAHEAWMQHEADVPPSVEAEEVVNRLYELSLTQKQALLKAIANS